MGKTDDKRTTGINVNDADEGTVNEGVKNPETERAERELNDPNVRSETEKAESNRDQLNRPQVAEGQEGEERSEVETQDPVEEGQKTAKANILAEQKAAREANKGVNTDADRAEKTSK